MKSGSDIRTFEDLIVWQKARIVAVKVYKLSGMGEFRNDYKFRSQIRSSSESTMSNIAEGFERFNPREFRNFLSIARGSTGELRSQLYLARDLNYISEYEADELIGICHEISKMIASLRKSLKNTDR